MTESEEAAYLQGERAAWRSILAQAVRELGMEGRSPESWILEREAAIAALRDRCRDYGDNDWAENLHLADVINKHIDWRGLD